MARTGDTKGTATPATGDSVVWPVQEARARLGALIAQALAGRPQRISRRGREVAVLLSAADYDHLTRPAGSLIAFFRDSPLAEAVAEGEIELERDRDPIRDLGV